MVRAIRCLIVLLAFVASVLPALAERKLAFVAGVNAYSRLPADQQLRRAVADAEAVAATLAGLGFQVTRLPQDATLFGFHTGFGAFTQSIEPGDTVLFFFAGHGVAIDTTNYLLPSDIPAFGPGAETAVKGMSIAEPTVIADIQGRGARVTVLVIDACRSNPFPKIGTRSLGLARGFVRAEPPEGVFSLYSAGAGQDALDRLSDQDGDANSVFTRVFLAEVRKPGTNVVDLGESVREQVSRLARGVGHQQVPAVYNQIIGARRIHLAGAAPAPPPMPEPPRPAPAPVDPDANTWLFLKESQDAPMLRRFADRLPPGPLRREVEARIAALPEARKEAALPPALAPVAPSPPVPAPPPARLPGADRNFGLALSEATDEVRRRFGIKETVKGVAVTGVDAGSAAAAREIKAGEVVVEVGQEAVFRPADVARQVDALKAEGRKSALLLVSTASGEVRFVALPIDETAATGARKEAALPPAPVPALPPPPAPVPQPDRSAERECDRLAAHPMDTQRPAGVTGVEIDKIAASTAIAACRRALDGDPASARMMFQLGRALSANRDDAAAADLYRKAGALSYAAAIGALGALTYYGDGVPRDLEAAVTLYRRAVSLGNGRATYNLGVMWEKGAYFSRDYKMAAQLYREATDLGDPFAMNNLGVLYRDGLGVEKDLSQAARLFKAAFDQGHGLATYNLAVAYYHGRGVEESDAEALFLARLATDRGQADGFYLIGEIYRRGDGVEVDRQRARSEYEQGRDRGCTSCRDRLAEMDQEDREAAAKKAKEEAAAARRKPARKR